MKKLVIYGGLNGIEYIKDRKSKKVIYVGDKKSKLGKVKTYPKSES